MSTSTGNRAGAKGAACDWLVGIDGGGTSTRLIIGDAQGHVLGEGSSLSGNLHDVGAERLRVHIGEAWRMAAVAANERGASIPRVARVLCAMASVVTRPDRDTVRSLVASLGIADPQHIDVETDLVAALAAAHGGAPGIVLIAGTGSSCLGRDPQGHVQQSGGWGSMLDDVGSATWLGTQAMAQAVRAHDGRGPWTCLGDALLARFDLAELRELLSKVDAEAMSRAERAKLAVLVTEAAEDGDEVARQILVRGAAGLAECVLAVRNRLEFGTESVAVAVTGGLAENVPAYRTLVHDAVTADVSLARCVLPQTTNAHGAYLECQRRHLA